MLCEFAPSRGRGRHTVYARSVRCRHLLYAFRCVSAFGTSAYPAARTCISAFFSSSPAAAVVTHAAAATLQTRIDAGVASPCDACGHGRLSLQTHYAFCPSWPSYTTTTLGPVFQGGPLPTILSAFVATAYLGRWEEEPLPTTYICLPPPPCHHTVHLVYS